MSPHVFIHANDTHAFKPSWIIDQQARPFGQDSGVGGIPGHAEGLGDTRHRQMMNDHASQRPAHRRPRELGAWIGRLAHILAPHMGALRAPVAAHAHVQDRGLPSVGLVCQAPDHCVMQGALVPAASTSPVFTSDLARQYCMVWPNALACRFQAQVIQACEGA